jgi:hypothetical protein
MGNPQEYIVKATYDFTVDATGAGGFPRTVSLAKTDNIPTGALVTEVIVEKVVTADSAGNASTYQIKGGGVALTAALTETNLTTAGYVAKATVAGANTTPIATTANGAIQVIIATEACTAGQFNVIIKYLLGSA